MNSSGGFVLTVYSGLSVFLCLAVFFQGIMISFEVSEPAVRAFDKEGEKDLANECIRLRKRCN